MQNEQGNDGRRLLSVIKAGLVSLEQRRWPIPTLFCLLHILIFILVFPSGGPDVEGYYHYATRIQEGQIPYHDFELEYPPGALIVFLLPRLFVDTLEAYGEAFNITMLVFDLISLLCALRLGRHIGLRSWKVAVLYTLATLAIGPIIVQRFDLAPTALTLLALCFFCDGRYESAWAWLAIGIMTKLYPAALAPLFLIHHLKHKERLADSLIVFALVMLAMVTPFLLVDREGFMQAFTVQGSRDLQLESTYASILLLGQMLGFGTAQIYQGRYSLDVEAPLSAPLAHYSVIVTAVCLIAVYIYFWRRYRKPLQGSSASATQLINFSLLVTLILLITSKVFSPQFIIWLLPLVALTKGHFGKAIPLIFMVMSCFTRYIYPVHYGELIDMQQLAIGMLFARNLMVIAMAVLLALDFHRTRVSGLQSIEAIPSI